MKQAESNCQTDLPEDKSKTYGRAVGDCGGHAVLRSHQDQGEGAHKWYHAYGCHRAGCACRVCIESYSKERARGVRGIFEGLERIVGEEVPLLAMVFTIPEELRDQEPRVLQKLRTRARAVVTGWVEEVNPELAGELDRRRHPGFMLGGMDLYHPVGDSDPNKWNPHIHMEVAGWAFHRESREWKRLKLRVSVEELASLRRRWGDVLAEELGWEEPDHERCAADYKYLKGKRRRNHRIKYDTRHFPAWTGQWRRVQWFGFLSSRSKAELDLRTPKEKKGVQEERDHDPRICPRCELPSEWDTTIKGKLLDRLFRGKLKKVPEAPPWFAEAVEVWFGEG